MSALAKKTMSDADVGEFSARQKAAAAAHRDRAIVGVRVNRIGEFSCGVCGAPIEKDEQGAYGHGAAR